MLDIQDTQVLRQRTGVLFVLVLVGHLVLESVTFGLFSRVQGALAAIVDVGRNGWGNYVALRGARAENEALKSQGAELEVRRQEQRALAARTVQLQELMDLKTTTTLPTV